MNTRVQLKQLVIVLVKMPTQNKSWPNVLDILANYPVSLRKLLQTKFAALSVMKVWIFMQYQNINPCRNLGEFTSQGLV